jgi:hypothetical protein
MHQIILKKGAGTLVDVLQLSYSFHQTCSKLGTATVGGLEIETCNITPVLLQNENVAQNKISTNTLVPCDSRANRKWF